MIGLCRGFLSLLVGFAMKICWFGGCALMIGVVGRGIGLCLVAMWILRCLFLGLWFLLSRCHEMIGRSLSCLVGQVRRSVVLGLPWELEGFLVLLFLFPCSWRLVLMGNLVELNLGGGMEWGLLWDGIVFLVGRHVELWSSCFGSLLEVFGQLVGHF